MIHDVSTDADDPPQFIALRDVRLACRNGAHYSGLRGAEHRQRYPDLVPADFNQVPASVIACASDVARHLGWACATATDDQIEATATTRWLQFKDDVVIRIRTHHSGTRLDIRSASRVGSSDLGANAKRIRTFLRELHLQLATTVNTSR